MKINQIRPLEAKFTEVLETIALKPKMLYYYGKMPGEAACTPLPEHAPGRSGQVSMSPKGERKQPRPASVAIVGARKYTAYGEETAYRAAYELAKRGVVIVSGLAIGIDSIAHKGALAAGGVTVAVLGTPIDRIYPMRHVGLAKEIIEKNGAVLSEYGPGEAAEGGMDARARFLYRNRLIAGLADVVLVVEATEHSGSLNTATHAIEQGRDLWAVPGDINRPTSRGCNKLIFQGANPYSEPADILGALGLTEVPQGEIKGDTPEETAILKLLSTGVREGEEIVAKLSMDVAEFNRTVTMLEIKGRVKALGANQWGVIG